MVWTQFHDMHSGGGTKEDYNQIFIQAPQDEAELIFYNRFGHNPYRVTCSCCGEDYSITEAATLEQATGYERACAYDKTGYLEHHNGNKWQKYRTVAEYIASDEAFFIWEADIKDEERHGELLRSGWDKCHCGEEIYTDDYGFTRGLCIFCSLERCDLPEEYPPSCAQKNPLVS
jgi:hypothetical protein